MSISRAALFLYDYTGIMAKPWAAAGYECYCVDLKHPSGYTWDADRRLWLVGTDMTKFMPKLREYAFGAAFPPCTHVAVSGSRHFAAKGIDKLIEALQLLQAARRIFDSFEAGTPWMIENPVSVFSSYWRKPDYTFDPCDYAGWCLTPEEREAEAYTKKTCLWTSSAFVMPEKRRVEPVLGSKMHLLPPSPDRADIRSATPKGFSWAAFEANRPRLARAA